MYSDLLHGGAKWGYDEEVKEIKAIKAKAHRITFAVTWWGDYFTWICDLIKCVILSKFFNEIFLYVILYFYVNTRIQDYNKNNTYLRLQIVQSVHKHSISKSEFK